MDQSAPQHWHAALGAWLAEQSADQDPAAQVWDAGQICAWQRNRDGSYGPHDPERGLLLYRLVQSRRVDRALQVETANGFGCVVMARAAADAGHSMVIDTVDRRPPDQKRSWTLHQDNADRTVELSIDDVFGQYFPALREVVRHHPGHAHRQLLALLKGGERYGLIVIDTGTSPYTLVRNLCYCIPMLEDDGALFLGALTPAAKEGLGPVMMLPHLRRLFVDVSLLHTGGMVWPLAQPADAWRGVVLASGHRFPEWRLNRNHLLYWRLMSWLMLRAYRKASTFPLKPDVD